MNTVPVPARWQFAVLIQCRLINMWLVRCSAIAQSSVTGCPGTAPGAVAAANLAYGHRRPDGLFGPPVGGVDGRVEQEEEHGGEFAVQMLGEALGGGQRRRGVDEPAEPGFEPAAGRRETVLADAAGVAARPQVEGVQKDRLHGGGPGAVGMIVPQVLAAPQEMGQAGLVGGGRGGGSVGRRWPR